ncbi:phosphotransferase enzyme family protein [Fredinandcohnia humi]
MTRIRLNGGFHNEVYVLEGEKKIVRISESRKSRDMVSQELAWMKFLYERGVALPKPEMALESEGGRVRTYFEFIKGEQIDVTNSAHWNPQTFKQFGRIIGKIHALSKEFETAEMHRPIWTIDNQDVYMIRNCLESLVQEKYDRLMAKLVSYNSSQDTFGLIHNDFHQGNLILTKQGELVTIDFDECAYNWYAQDIAVMFYHAFWQDSSFNGESDHFCHTFMGNFFKGYIEENLLHEDIIKQIPIFLKLREIFLFRLFLEKWDMANLEEWQEYTINSLKENITNDIPYAGVTDFSIYL